MIPALTAPELVYARQTPPTPRLKLRYRNHGAEFGGRRGFRRSVSPPVLPAIFTGNKTREKGFLRMKEKKKEKNKKEKKKKEKKRKKKKKKKRRESRERRKLKGR